MELRRKMMLKDSKREPLPQALLSKGKTPQSRLGLPQTAAKTKYLLLLRIPKPKRCWISQRMMLPKHLLKTPPTTGNPL